MVQTRCRRSAAQTLVGDVFSNRLVMERVVDVGNLGLEDLVRLSTVSKAARESLKPVVDASCEEMEKSVVHAGTNQVVRTLKDLLRGGSLLWQPGPLELWPRFYRPKSRLFAPEIVHPVTPVHRFPPFVVMWENHEKFCVCRGITHTIPPLGTFLPGLEIQVTVRSAWLHPERDVEMLGSHNRDRDRRFYAVQVSVHGFSAQDQSDRYLIFTGGRMYSVDTPTSVLMLPGDIGTAPLTRFEDRMVRDVHRVLHLFTPMTPPPAQ